MSPEVTRTIDLDVVKELVSLAATSEGAFLHESLNSFEQRCKNFLAVIDEGIANQDEKKVANNAHALAGSAAILGAVALRASLIRMEDDARSGDWKAVFSNRSQLDDLYKTSCRELKLAFEAE